MDTERYEALFSALHGNSRLKSFLISELQKHRLSHAYILEGPPGSGKLTLAKLISAALAPEHSNKILTSGSVDVNIYSLTDDKRSIGISTVREIKYKAELRPQELPCEIFIIRDAHTLTTEAQNSLLKILEEPPQGVYFFLLCETASSLLPTVRSRAPVLRMEVFGEDELEDILLQKEKKARTLKDAHPEEFADLLKASQGTLGNALNYLLRKSSERVRLREKADELVQLLRDGKRTELLIFFVTLDLTREELTLLLEHLAEATRDMLAVKKGGSPTLSFYTSQERAEEDAFAFAAQTLMELYDRSAELMEALAVNVNQSIFAIHCATLLSDAL